jgi:hypothetical protein
MLVDMGQEEPERVARIGTLASRHNGVLLEGSWLKRFVASDSPWLVFEVRTERIVIQRDPRPAARFRRGANAVVPMQAMSLVALASREPLIWKWSQIRSNTSTSRKVAKLETASVEPVVFRFGSSNGHYDTFIHLRELAPSSSVSIGTASSG